MPEKRIFLSEGFSEIGRMARRRNLRAELATQARRRQEALAQLGRSAWEAKIDLGGFAELRTQLTNIEQRAGELSATSRQLEQQKATVEKQHAGEVARFDTLRQPVVEGQRQADAAQRTAREQLGNHERTIQGLQSRMAELAAASAKLQSASTQPAAESAPQANAPISQPSREQIEAEQASLAGQLSSAWSSKNTQAAKVELLSGESRQWADKLAEVEAQRKAALAPLDGELQRIAQELGNATRQTSVLANAQTESFTRLGGALYDAKVTVPALTGNTQAVAVIDQSTAATQSALDASLALTRAMPPGTMLKFWLVIILVPAVVVAAIYGFSSLSGAGAETAAATTASAKEEVQRDAAVHAFLDSPADQSKRRAAVHILRQDILLLGSSANPAYLPRLVTILRNGEPELRSAAAHAIGMAGPGANELPPLRAALNDPVPSVRNAALLALQQSKDAPTQLLVRRAQAAAPGVRPQKPLEPQAAPDAARIGAAVYNGATFLFFASDPDAGRAAFLTPDSTQKVIDFYSSAAGAIRLMGEEFAQRYATPPHDGATIVSKYADRDLYGTPTFVTLRETPGDSNRIASCLVVVFEDHAFQQTGLDLYCKP
ncbi:MAG: HEAT repeat domain-containing protein [Acidobacteriia bacterium]|nr:HEAT repeat domain-containing protein [Terriglobia bacterium]